MKDTILIVEDELIVARDIRNTLERNGFKVVGVARTAEKAMSLIAEFSPSLVLVDIFLKGNTTGIDLATHLNEKGIPFIYVSANSNQQVLEAAKTTNPYGFVVKPFRDKDLLVTIDIARFRYESKKKMDRYDVATGKESIPQMQIIEKEKAISRRSPQLGCENIVGRSAPMIQVFNLIQQVAPFDTSVLILGESGTGKEGVANCIVQQSPRKNKPYIKVNCAAVPASLMESEFFGYEKGAFTGATERKPGKFEIASGGSILLDEVGELTPELQAKLLRVLQEKEVHRIGSSTVIKVDVRVLAATSKNLEKEVGEGRFRLDLYYRLLVFPIYLPPLRDRKEDIPLLVDHFIRLYSEKNAKGINAPSHEFMARLLQYSWPGNVRELQHFIERMMVMGDTEIPIGLDLPDLSSPPGEEGKKNPHVKTLQEMERDYILSVLNKCNFKIAGKGGAAELLNIPPTTLHSKMKKLGIKIRYE